MSQEEKIKQNLIKEFDYLKDAIIIPRGRRMNADLSPDKLFEVLEFLIKKEGLVRIPAITGMDEGDTFAVIYHLDFNGLVLNLRVHIPREAPVIKTITAYFAAADIYERELIDLLGIKVEGLPLGQRYPLSDNWPQGVYPLRKDYKEV